MPDQQLLKTCQKTSSGRILLVVIDGLGGLPHQGPESGGKSELERANLPNLDELARHPHTVLGTLYPVARGFVPGSAAGHFGLLGYDPLLREHHVGRGVLEALDLGLSLEPGDVVARLNFATVVDGTVTDRRAGRIADAAPLAVELNRCLVVKGAKVEVIATREYRGVLVLRHIGQPLSAEVTDTDPRDDGNPIQRCFARNAADPVAQRTAQIINAVSGQALAILKPFQDSNAILIRGFSSRPALPTLGELHGLEALAIADYPLYRGIGKLLGMSVCDPVQELSAKVQQLSTYYDEFTFFFMHYKKPDVHGEDGEFDKKVRALEEFDAIVPEIRKIMKGALDVIAITGDHSTPSVLKAHSHHPVPLLLFAAQSQGYETAQAFNERECAHGTFGRARGVELMSSLLAEAGKVTKFDL